MEDLIAIKNEIKQYYKMQKDNRTQTENMDIELKKIGGLSNINYIIVVKDMSTNETIAQILYRKFGALSKGVNHELETTIIKFTLKKGHRTKTFI